MKKKFSDIDLVALIFKECDLEVFYFKNKEDAFVQFKGIGTCNDGKIAEFFAIRQPRWHVKIQVHKCWSLMAELDINLFDNNTVSIVKTFVNKCLKDDDFYV